MMGGNRDFWTFFAATPGSLGVFWIKSTVWGCYNCLKFVQFVLRGLFGGFLQVGKFEFRILRNSICSSQGSKLIPSLLLTDSCRFCTSKLRWRSVKSIRYSKCPQMSPVLAFIEHDSRHLLESIDDQLIKNSFCISALISSRHPVLVSENGGDVRLFSETDRCIPTLCNTSNLQRD